LSRFKSGAIFSQLEAAFTGILSALKIFFYPVTNNKWERHLAATSILKRLDEYHDI
jgi:hypothetical protein